MRSIIFIITTLLFSSLSVNGQNSLLDQYIFSSDDDSMLIVDYLDPKTNYVFTLYGDWCGWCKKELRDYEDIYPQWQEDFNMKFVVLDDYGSDDIEQAIQDLSDYPYEIFVTKAIRMPLGVTGFPRNYFVSTGKELVYEKPGYASPEDMTELLDLLFDKNLRSNLPSNLTQATKVFNDCETEWQTGQLTEEVIEFNEHNYQVFKRHGRDHYIREEIDYSKVYIYNEDKDEEHTLLDFTKEICETVSIYSVLTDSLLDLKVLDKYCVGQDQYLELDLKIADCEAVETNLTFISGKGSNAGLVPIFDQNFCYSHLNCQWEDGLMVFSETEDCLLLNDEELIVPEASVHIWPNPANDFLSVALSEGSSEGNITITSIRGEVLFRSSIQNRAEIKLSGFSAGIYLLTYTSKEGQSLTKKIIIQ